MQCETRDGVADSRKPGLDITPIAEGRALAAKDSRISSVVELGPSSATT